MAGAMHHEEEMEGTRGTVGISFLSGIVPDTSMKEIYRSVLPFIAIDCIAITLLVIFPTIANWLPSIMG